VKILYMNPTGALGGAERSLLDLMGAVRCARPDWTLDLMAGSDGELATAAEKLGVNVRMLPMPAVLSRLGDAGAGGPAGNEVSKAEVLARLSFTIPSIAVYVAALRRLIRSCKPNVIHSNGFKTHLLAVWAVPRHYRIIWHVRDYVGSRPLMSRLIGLHAGQCSIALVNSNSVARDLDAVCGGRLEIRTVYNAVDLERFGPEGPALDLDRLSGLPPAPAGCLRVGLVTTMARWKGQEVFLRALSMLPVEPMIRGYIVGGPIYETVGSQYTIAELRRVAAELGIEGQVGFTGFVMDPASAIRALDVVVHASTQPEPFGRVVAEAMACGKPVVASKGGGVAELISDNETAVAHPPGDAVRLAECIQRLAANPALGAKLGTTGRCWAEERFEAGRLAREVIPIYELSSEDAQ
jgi:glycosyltransferase involved in cell wall biosynthesis